MTVENSKVKNSAGELNIMPVLDSTVCFDFFSLNRKQEEQQREGSLSRMVMARQGFKSQEQGNAGGIQYKEPFYIELEKKFSIGCIYALQFHIMDCRG